jgi:hypothetical protein
MLNIKINPRDNVIKTFKASYFQYCDKNGKFIHVVTKKITDENVLKIWKRITDKPMPSNIYAFIILKKKTSRRFMV